jgi:hypothetical protein
LYFSNKIKLKKPFLYKYFDKKRVRKERLNRENFIVLQFLSIFRHLIYSTDLTPQNMNTAPRFDKSFLLPMVSVLNSDYWTVVMNTYEQGQHLATVHAVLDYVQKGLSDKSLDTEKTRYVIPHGSTIVNLEIADNILKINAPFLRIPARSLIPLMRQVAEINFGTLVLAQIMLENDEIFFRYECPLELCEPFKLYRVLEEICIQADANDDLFIEKFGAQRLAQMQVEHFTAEQTELCYQMFQTYLQEALDYIAYYEQRRIEYFGWDALYLAYTKIDYFMRPQGVMKSNIEKAIKELNSDLDMGEKVNKGKATVQKWLQMEKERFVESMYKSNQFISEKLKFEVSGVQDYLNKTHNTARDERNKRDYIGSALSMMCGFYGLMFYYNIPQTTHELIVEGLEKAGGVEWELASQRLWETLDNIMSQSNRTANSYGLRDVQ